MQTPLEPLYSLRRLVYHHKMDKMNWKKIDYLTVDIKAFQVYAPKTEVELLVQEAPILIGRSTFGITRSGSVLKKFKTCQCLKHEQKSPEIPTQPPPASTQPPQPLKANFVKKATHRTMSSVSSSSGYSSQGKRNLQPNFQAVYIFLCFQVLWILRGCLQLGLRLLWRSTASSISVSPRKSSTLPRRNCLHKRKSLQTAVIAHQMSP